jgi:2-haloacid dehalogenase/putative hydrolase of the HAD superfamily
MMLDGIFLDFYGTLTAGDRQAVETVCEAIVRETGLTISAYELSVTWGERFFHALDECNGDGFLTLFDVEVKTLRQTLQALDAGADAPFYARQLQTYWQCPPLQPEVREFLPRLRLPVCIVSNADRADIDVALKRHELAFEHVVTSEDARSYKPDRAIFELALARTGWRRDRVIHVGDSLHSDVGGALVAGITSGWLNRAQRIHDIGTHRPDYEFDDLLALLSLVDSP